MMRRAPGRDSMARSQRAGGRARSTTEGDKVLIDMRSITFAFTRRARLLLALPLCLATMLLLGTNEAVAAAPFAAHGTFAVTSSTQSNIKFVGCCLVFFDQTSTDTLTGTLSGTDVFHAPCQLQ